MPIKPLDMQVMIPKTSEVGKQQQHGLNKNNLDQFNLNIINNKKNDLKQKQVIEKENSSNVTLNNNKKGDSNSQTNSRRDNKKQQPKDDNKQQAMNCYKNGHFDVRI